MRHEPVLIRAVAMKTASKMIVHPAHRHLLQGERRHFLGSFPMRAMSIAEQKIANHRLGKLRSAAETTEPAIVWSLKHGERVVEKFWEDYRLLQLDGARAPNLLDHLLTLPDNFRAPIRP